MQEHPEVGKETNEKSQMSTQFVHLPDSEHYIHKLENRLSKLKGSEKNLSSKSMLSVLQQAKDDYLNHLLSSSIERLSSLDDNADKEVAVSYIEKKLFPEKNGVTQEELLHLLESDVLAKVTAENCSTETLSDVNVDR